MSRRIALGVMTALICVACGSPTTPSLFSGTWSGSAKDSFGGDATLRLDLTQANGDLTGTWTLTFLLNTNVDNGGTVDGTARGLDATIDFVSSGGRACSYIATATVSGSVMTGTYTATNCNLNGVPFSGTFNLTQGGS